MVEARVLYARSGELELRLESLPPPASFVSEQPKDEDADERHFLETLLHSSGGDAEAFLAASKRMRAA
jgi:hypothetical protein